MEHKGGTSPFVFPLCDAPCVGSRFSCPYIHLAMSVGWLLNEVIK